MKPESVAAMLNSSSGIPNKPKVGISLIQSKGNQSHKKNRYGNKKVKTKRATLQQGQKR